MIVSSSILAAFKTSKFGSKASNCADSFAISPDARRIAIADGVSKSYMPKFVADSLTEIYVSDKFTGGTLFNDTNATELLSNVVEEWNRKSHVFEASVDEDTAYDLEYQRELYGMGASTFAGICLSPELFTFDILGDSCIFLIPNDKAISPLILSSMPCDVDLRSDTPFKCDFGIHPHFIDTKGRIVGEPLEDSIQAFDCTILLATDAFSDWFCRNYTKEDINHVIDTLKGLDTQEKFDSFIDNLRDNDLKNDDVAIVLVDVRLIENESVLSSKDDTIETDAKIFENIDGKSATNSTDEIEGCIVDSKNREEITSSENPDTGISNDFSNSGLDEETSDLIHSHSDVTPTEELPKSEMSENKEGTNSDDNESKIIDMEENSAYTADDTINQKSNLIARFKKCLGLS